MNPQPKQLTIKNNFRSTIFLLLVVESFLLAWWLVPYPASLAMLVLIVIALLFLFAHPRFRAAFQSQIADRIELQEFGVAYSSGWCGEEWLRPYNEFRVECCIMPRWYGRRYIVRLNHRVLKNIQIVSTRQQSIATRTANELVEHSRLKMLRH